MSRQKISKNVQQEKQLEVDMVHDKSSRDAVELIEEATEAHISTVTLEVLESDLDRVRAELESTKIELEEKKKSLKAIPMRELDEDEMILVKKQADRSATRSVLKDKIEKQKEYDDVMVTGKFRNLRVQGQPAKLTYHKYATDPVKWTDFQDGKVYTIPRGFADQINGGDDVNPCYYTPGFIQKTPQESLDPNKPSSSISAIDTSNKKYAFIPTHF